MIKLRKKYGVPQGSVPGPLMCCLYMHLSADISRYNGTGSHRYDRKLYMSSTTDVISQFAKLHEHNKDI